MNADPTEEQDPNHTTADTGLQIASAKNFTAAVDAYAMQPSENVHGTPALWFISLLGAQSAVKAISASILKGPGEIIHLTPLDEDGEPVYNKSIFTARGKESGPWTRRILQLPGTRAWHCLVYPRQAEEPADDGSMLILGRKAGTGDADEAEIHLRKLNQAISIPVHASWAQWVWQRGQELDEINELDGSGIKAWVAMTDEDLLREEISQAVADGELKAETE